MSLNLHTPTNTAFLSTFTTLTIISSLASSALSTTGNFCPVEGSDYFDKPEGNVIKVTSPSDILPSLH